MCLFEWGVVCGKILKFMCTIFSNSYDDIISISVDAIITVIYLGQLTSRNASFSRVFHLVIYLC